MAACRLCGWICIWRPALNDYLRDQDVIILGGGCRGPLPRCIRWIVVLLAEHHRKLKINGQLSNAWRLRCSIYQGCPLAPSLYAIACEMEGRRQIWDVRVRTQLARGCRVPDARHGALHVRVLWRGGSGNTRTKAGACGAA
eukprot:COSAG06_NODE_24101_length_672_cov_10.694590_1_plen_140_part_01